mmetsp:Transcript_7129/g.13174  ORF Transcript_7129/g.13174 Transcript_7129/m.13174 type:complete len:584 (+) Transcript_7129:232-1983(+)
MMKLHHVLALNLLVIGICEVSASAPQCTAEGEGECNLSPKKVRVHNNGVNDYVEMEVSPTEDIQTMIDDMALAVRAGDTLEPHQFDYGMGEPWRLYTGRGREIKSWNDFQDGERVYVVPTGLLFMWPTVEINHTVVLDDIYTTNGEPIVLRTLNHSPKVFEIENLLTPDEAELLRLAALNVDHTGNKFQRSTTGHTGNVDPFRTSDNAFVHAESEISINLTKRAFESIMMEYDVKKGDGIQVLRYNASGGYRWHTDWFPEKTVYGRNHDVTRGGANRFATIFFYLSDVEWGGQTGFPEAEGDTSELEKSMEKAREMFKPNSWEMQATEKCFGRFSVKPAKGRAILFYSLQPNGRGDSMSMHTGCPVLEGQKWAANLWIWNKDRDFEVDQKKRVPMTVTFVNRMDETALISWVTNPRHVQGEIAPNKAIKMSTYDTDSFVFRDETRKYVLAKWTADLKKGEDQVVNIYRGMGEVEGADANEAEYKPVNTDHIEMTLTNSFDVPVDVYWANNLAQPVVSIQPKQQFPITTYDGHGFKIFKKGVEPKEEEQLYSFTVNEQLGNKQTVIMPAEKEEPGTGLPPEQGA